MNLNLKQQVHFKIAGLSSEPNTHNRGSMYYNTTNNNFYVALSNTQTTP